MEIRRNTWLTTLALLHIVLQTGCQAAENCTLESKGDLTNKYILNCADLGFTQVPTSFPHGNKTIIGFSLEQNKIETIDGNAFTNYTDLKWLRINKNNIKNISPKAFYGLRKLKHLDLSGNNFTGGILMPGVFEPFSFSLITLDLHENNLGNLSSLNQRIGELRALEELYISSCENCYFGTNFKKLSNFSLLDLWAEQNSSQCNINTLTQEFLSNLVDITVLKLVNCNITSIERLTFSSFHQLEVLDLSYNRNLTFDKLADMYEGLVNTSIKKFYATAITPFSGTGVFIRKQGTEHLKKLTHLEKVVLNFNKIEGVDKEVLWNLPNSLRELSIRTNRLTFGTDPDLTWSCKQCLKNLQFLDISEQHLFYNPFVKHNVPSPEKSHIQLHTRIGSIANQTSNDDTFSLSIPPNMKTIRYRKSFIFMEIKSIKFELNTLEKLDLSFNLLHTWTGPVVGLTKLKYLYLPENYCKKVDPHFFDNFPSLEVLDLYGNFLGLDLRNDNEGNLFRNLNNLQVLNISDIRATKLPANIFRGLTSIRVLDVSNNQLIDWEADLRHMTCLQALDLSNNQLEVLTDATLDDLVSISKRLDGKCKNLTEVRVRLAGNNIVCACRTLEFLKRMSTIPEVYFNFTNTDECRLANGERKRLSSHLVVEEIVQTLEKECVSYTVWIAFGACAIGVFITILSGGLSYRYRWKLRHWYYKRRRRHPEKWFERIFDHDAFVSYASQEGRFIKNCLVQKLQKENGLSLCVSDRDFLPGTTLAENITHAIYSSRKTVLIITRSFLQSYWCIYEINMARVESIETGRKLIILVLYENIPAHEYSSEVLSLLRTEKYLEFPQRQEDEDAFWDDLTACIEQD